MSKRELYIRVLLKKTSSDNEMFNEVLQGLCSFLLFLTIFFQKSGIKDK